MASKFYSNHYIEYKSNGNRNNALTIKKCLATMNEHLELAITEVDIELTHRIGKPRDVGNLCFYKGTYWGAAHSITI